MYQLLSPISHIIIMVRSAKILLVYPCAITH